MTPITISVTEEDIRIGIVGSCAFCPVASAMDRAGLPEPSASYEFLSWEKEDARAMINTPSRVCNWMIDFDEDLPVSPFTFELRDESL